MAKKKSKTTVWIIVLAVAVIAGGTALVLTRNRDEGIKVTTEKISRRTITQTVSAIGKIQPETEVKISSEASGEITFLGVKDGEQVKKGQLLVRILPDLVTSQVEQFAAAEQSAKIGIDAVKAELDRAQQDLKRISELYKKQFASKDELDRTTAAALQAESRYQSALKDYDRARAALRQVQAQASRTTIYSPMEGTVTKLVVEQGEKVVGTAQMQGTEMMRIANLTVMNAWVDVDENDVVLVKIGDTAKVSIDALPDAELSGVVYEIAHSAKVSGAGTQEEVTNFEVRIRIIDSEKRLRPGMSCNVDIETETHRNVLAAPLQAVTVRENAGNAAPDISGSGIQTEENKNAEKMNKKPQSIIFLNNKNRAKSVNVETGLSDRGYIEIKSGLKEGDEIISGNFQAVSKLLSDSAKIIIDSAPKYKKKSNYKQSEK
ncbi:efflux RND transporter periplasmic adaptor subunit [Ignavibacteria bacterium]|nr:efflux RND transporter periplasmic adaptor subunit [Bacteroidota bacterium]MCZ2131766.1 efflux RND transporter periplasmic adaptor subunit [Bacteroidota bacterium]